MENVVPINDRAAAMLRHPAGKGRKPHTDTLFTRYRPSVPAK